MNTPFVGQRRHLALERLIADFAAVSSTRTPQFVFLEAPLGWGKTRIVHELYARLASQQADAYWPASIVDDAPITDGGEVSRRRKRLAPGEFAVRRTAVPEWVWLGVEIDASVIGTPERAYASLVSQLQRHVYPVLRRQRITAAAARALLSTVGGLLPIPTEIGSVLDLADGAREVFEEWWDGREKTRTVGGEPADTPAAFWKLLTAVWGVEGKGGPPIVIVVEDAHYMSESTIEMIGSVLAGDFPILIVATGWPLIDGDRYRPLREFVKAQPARLRTERLDELDPADAREIILSLHPGTQDAVLEMLVRRFATNPYALQLFLWNHDAEAGRPFQIDDLPAIESADSYVHSELRLLLDRYPRRARAAVMIAALIGYRVPVEMGDAATLVHADGLLVVEALQTDWMRHDWVNEGILAFVEPIRHETAAMTAASSISLAKRQAVVGAAVKRLQRLLEDDSEDDDRRLLESLYVELGVASGDRDENLFAECICSLLSSAWTQRANQRGIWLLKLIDDELRSDALTPSVRAQVAAEYARRYRLFVSLADLRREQLTARALELALLVSDEAPATLALALLERSRVRSSKDLPGFDLDEAWRLSEEATAVASRLDAIPAKLGHSLRARHYALISARGDRETAYELAMLEAERCAADPQLAGYSMSESLSDAAFYMARVDPIRSFEPSRSYITALIEIHGTATHPRVAAAEKDLAVRMLRAYRDDLVDEAYGLAARSHTMLLSSQGAINRTTLAALAARAHATRRRSQIAWFESERTLSLELAELALGDFQKIAIARRALHGRNEDTIATRTHLALAEAWAGDRDAVERAHDCLKERLTDLGEAPDRAEILWLARDVRDAMLRHNMARRADRIGREYSAAFEPPFSPG